MTTDNAFLAGWASVEITPALPCWMAGYAARRAPANALHDPLYASALALGTQQQPLVLVICDILAVNDFVVQEVRRRGMSLLPGATIWLGATHTHSGPDVARPLSVASKPPNPEGLIAGSIQATKEAIRSMRPVRIAWASGKIGGVATNRDHPENSADISLDMLCFYDTVQSSRGNTQTLPDSEFARPAAVFGSFPCHPTVLSAENLTISADLPGAFRRQLQSLLGADTWVMLATGAAGDISTRHTRQAQSFDELERLGRLLAKQAYFLVPRARLLQVSSPLLYETAVELEAKAALSPESLKEYTSSLRTKMEQELQAGNVAQARTLETALQGLEAAAVPQKHTLAHLGRKRQVEVSVATLGELALVAVPGELYNRLGAELRRERSRPLLLLGYMNGYIGYLPTHKAYAEIDYEVLMSPFAPGSGERVQDALRMLLTS